MQCMSHAHLLGLQVILVVLCRSHLNSHILHNLQAESLQTYALYRIVGEQTHLAYAQFLQNLRTGSVFTLVGLESQMQVGIYGIHALLLQFVGANLIHQSYAAAFLAQVQDYTFASFLYFHHGAMQLLATVATLTSEDVTGHAG